MSDYVVNGSSPRGAALIRPTLEDPRAFTRPQHNRADAKYVSQIFNEVAAMVLQRANMEHVRVKNTTGSTWAAGTLLGLETAKLTAQTTATATNNPTAGETKQILVAATFEVGQLIKVESGGNVDVGIATAVSAGVSVTVDALYYDHETPTLTALPAYEATLADRSTPVLALWVVKTQIAAGAYGDAFGCIEVTGLDTSAASAAEALAYLSTAGGWTTTEPGAPKQIVGVVTVKHVSTGAIRFFPGASWLKPAVIFNDAEGDPSAVATAASDGTSDHPARRDHTHAIGVDNSSIEMVGGNLQVKAGGVGASHLADGAALAEILDDDGPGSGLDADTLDGEHASAFTTTAHLASICEGRLSLVSGNPVPTTDVSGTNIYFVPYKGNKIAFYESGQWVVRSFTNFAWAIDTSTSDRPHDLFFYYDGGSALFGMEAVPWSSKTARATALATQDGVYVKSGETHKRYLGTFHTVASNSTEDSATKRLLWNMYNRVPRHVGREETSASWSWTGTGYRALNNSTSNRIEYVCGFAEGAISAHVNVMGRSNDASARQAATGVGVDSTTVNSAQLQMGDVNASTGMTRALFSHYTGATQLGYHYLQALEYVSTGGAVAVNFYTQNAQENYGAGIVGVLHE